MQFTSNEIDAEPISGRSPLKKTTEELDALVQFYRAFNTRDLELISENWLDSGESSMSNPFGGIARGWPRIKAIYERILSGHAGCRVVGVALQTHSRPLPEPGALEC